MTQPPPRHPLFVAIACIALAGAWATGVYEAEAGDSLALLARDGSPRQLLAADCPGPRGPTRALCVFEASRPSRLLNQGAHPLLAPSPGRVAAASSLRVAARKVSAGPDAP